MGLNYTVLLTGLALGLFLGLFASLLNLIFLTFYHLAKSW